jgi:hypothetical protein
MKRIIACILMSCFLTNIICEDIYGLAVASGRDAVYEEMQKMLSARLLGDDSGVANKEEDSKELYKTSMKKLLTQERKNFFKKVVLFVVLMIFNLVGMGIYMFFSLLSFPENLIGIFFVIGIFVVIHFVFMFFVFNFGEKFKESCQKASTVKIFSNKIPFLLNSKFKENSGEPIANRINKKKLIRKIPEELRSFIDYKYIKIKYQLKDDQVRIPLAYNFEKEYESIISLSSFFGYNEYLLEKVIIYELIQCALIRKIYEDQFSFFSRKSKIFENKSDFEVWIVEQTIKEFVLMYSNEELKAFLEAFEASLDLEDKQTKREFENLKFIIELCMEHRDSLKDVKFSFNKRLMEQIEKVEPQDFETFERNLNYLVAA